MGCVWVYMQKVELRYWWEYGDDSEKTFATWKGNDKDASKPVARHLNRPNHSKQHTAVCGLSLSLHLGS